MLLGYEWPGLWDETPEVGTKVDVSGDPDKPMLKGIVARVEQADNEPPVLAILMADGQDGAQEFQEWVEAQGDIGVEVSEEQGGVALL